MNSLQTLSISICMVMQTTNMTNTTMSHSGDAGATIDPGKWSGEKEDFKFWWQHLKCFLEFKEKEGMMKKGVALLVLLQMGGTLDETLASNKI